jgi:hypothetical protein
MAVSHVPRRNYPVQRSRWSIAVGPGMIVGAAATIALVVSMFMSWRAGSVHPSEIPASFLWDKNASGDPSLLIFLIPLAVLLGIGSFMRGGAPLRMFAGFLAMVVVGLFAYQLHELTDAVGARFGDALDPGFYVAGIAAVVGFVSGFLPTTLATRRTYDDAYGDRVDDDVVA